MDRFTPEDMEEYRQIKFRTHNEKPLHIQLAETIVGQFYSFAPIKYFLDQCANKTHDRFIREFLQDHVNVWIIGSTPNFYTEHQLDMQHTIIPILPYHQLWTQEELEWLTIKVSNNITKQGTIIKRKMLTHPKELLYVLGKLFTTKFPDDKILNEIWTDIQYSYGLLPDEETYDTFNVEHV